jgi:hypothetical protein
VRGLEYLEYLYDLFDIYVALVVITLTTLHQIIQYSPGWQVAQLQGFSDVYTSWSRYVVDM